MSQVSELIERPCLVIPLVIQGAAQRHRRRTGGMNGPVQGHLMDGSGPERRAWGLFQGGNTGSNPVGGARRDHAPRRDQKGDDGGRTRVL
jgi:hypothetical protein